LFNDLCIKYLPKVLTNKNNDDHGKYNDHGKITCALSLCLRSIKNNINDATRFGRKVMACELKMYQLLEILVEEIGVF